MELTLTEESSRPTAGAREARTQIQQWQDELDGYYQLMSQFSGMETDEIMERLAGMAARLSEIRVQAVRMPGKASNHFRTQEIDKTLDSLEFVFKCYSRALTVRTMEAELSGRTT